MNPNRSAVALHLILTPKHAPSFFPLFQKGISLKARLGSSVREFLCGQLGLAPEYLEERVQTVFLDGNAVDDLDKAAVKEGSTIALSAAMPGLAGATLRRGGHLATLRSQITHREGEEATRLAGEGLFTLKIFNLLLNDLVPAFLGKGVFIPGQDFRDLLRGLSPDFWRGFRKAQIDGKEADLGAVRRGEWLENHSLVFLSVLFENS